jgi:hypothetical protein
MGLSAGEILRQLSSNVADADRLVRAVDHARQDAQAVIDADNYLDEIGKAEALAGSLTAIHSVCADLGV